MSRTEQRVMDALHARAGQVRDESLRPLPGPGQARASRAARYRVLSRPGMRYRPAWLAPLAAAACMLLVIGAVAAVTSALKHRYGTPPANPAQHIPEYVAEFAGPPLHAGVTVYDTRSGAVVAHVSAPAAPPAGEWNGDAIAAAPDDRTFYVLYDMRLSQNGFAYAQTLLYSFRVNGPGSASAITAVPGGTISQVNTNSAGDVLISSVSMAVSPDGSAVALITTPLPGSLRAIVVVDVRTGARRTWTGGLDRPGQQLMIPDVSWAGPRSLVFLAMWCPVGWLYACEGQQAQVRTLDLTGTGGSLAAGRALLAPSARFPFINLAFAGPDGEDLTIVATVHGRAGVYHVSASGTLLGTYYRVPEAPDGVRYPDGLSFAADPTGRYLLFTCMSTIGLRGGQYTGWIGGGGWHLLPVHQSYFGARIEAW